MLNYRYVLHLHDGEREQIVRHASFRPLAPGAVISIADAGDWVVREIITSQDAAYRDGIAICERRSGD
jgi:hypothetical protein